MPKRIALITARCCLAEIHRQTLAHLFGDEIELRQYTYDNGSICEPLEGDVFVISIYQIYLDMQRCIPVDAKVVIINNTITEEQYRKVSALPAGTSALLVNYNVEMTMDTISMFHQLGLNHLEFVPCYPGVKGLPELAVAVTPGEPKYVPPFVKRVVDIGDRVMDVRTIINIATALGLDPLLKEERFTTYFKSIRMSPDSVTSLFDRTNILESRLSRLLDVLDDGILIIENTGLVCAGNRKARELLGSESDFAGVMAGDLIPGIPFNQVFDMAKEVDYTLVKIRSQDISVKVVPVIAQGGAQGALAILNAFEEKEKNQHRLRSQLLGKGHRSRYTFDSILTQDPVMGEIKNLALRKARSDASVLIVGETGTGKELFAHAIHDASRRKGWQFVTVNCAALPETLLESELFGYEEGAFTGARKGGKPGLFELAHQGTIFLDEIGEMELSLQARLLRVLESREVMRIGGDRMINVDIRIIAATNKDLWKRVEDGQFRKDLYYRLNVLPIEIPPLRERRGDILLLLDHLKRTSRAEFELAPAAMAAISRYNWHGNVRELKNLVDYLAYLGKAVVEERDLSPILKWPAAMPTSCAPTHHPRHDDVSELKNLVDYLAHLGKAVTEERDHVSAPKRKSSVSRTDKGASVVSHAPVGADRDHCRFILECLHACHRQKIRSGRRTLHQQALERDLFLTEAQIRKLLVHMERSGLVLLSPGRGGTTITNAGIDALKKMETV